MATKVKELPKVMNLPACDNTCLTCHPVKKGHISADQLWAGVLSGKLQRFDIKDDGKIDLYL
jgi:hypothetical protein